MAEGKVTIKVEVDGKQVELDLEKIKQKIKEVDNTEAVASEDATRDVKALDIALGAIAASLVAVGLKAYDMSSAFGAAFAKTQTIIDENAVSARKMRSAVLSLSRDSALAADDVSEAVYQAISGSVDTADAVQFVDKANKLAVAGFTSLSNATDVLTTALNSYHLGADKVLGISNVLIRTQNLGKTSVDELSSSMGKAIATGSAYDVDLQNISTAYVELTRNGIATAESTTYINSMLNELGDSGKTVGKILGEQTGKSFGQLMQEGRSLADVLNILLKSVDGNTEALMGLWGSQEAGKAANAIVSQSLEDFNEVLNQMNSEMSGATGTTEKAYETMTSTSEFIDRRLTNSVQNLAIAYGDILTPPMDAIKSLGADILAGLAELINQSPVAASAIAAVSTGVVVLAGGLAALLIIEKVKAAFADFTSVLTLASHPVLLAVAGLSALALGVYSLVSSTADANEQLDVFNERIDTLDKNLNSDLATVDVAAKRTRDYIVRLEELDAAGEKTAEQQEEYHAILVKLIKAVPKLADIIDLETDSIEGGTKALWKNTEAWEENARQQAYQKYLADITDEYTQALIKQRAAEIALTNNRKKRQEQEAQERTLLWDRNQLMREAAELADEFNRTYEGASASADEFYERTSFGTGALQSFNDALSELHDSMQDTDDETKSLKKDLNDANAVVDIAKEKYDAAKDVINSFGDTEELTATITDTATASIQRAGEAAEKASDQIIEIKSKTPAITEAIQKWADKYGDLYQAAKDSLEKQFKLWDEVKAVTATSVESANRGIQSQIDYWQDYNRNLNEIKDSGIAGMDLLYKHISDRSTESVAMAAGIAEAIRSGNQPEVEKLIELFRTLQEAQAKTVETTFGMQNDMDQAYEELVLDTTNAIKGMSIPESAQQAGRETILGYARGLYSGKTDVQKAARGVVNAAASALGSKVSAKPYEQMYASGTNYAATGFALVGEEGPELIYLRGGERILTAEETRSALRGMYAVPSSVSSYSRSTAPASIGSTPDEHRQMTIVVPLEIDGREIARATAQTMGEEMMFSGF